MVSILKRNSGVWQDRYCAGAYRLITGMSDTKRHLHQCVTELHQSRQSATAMHGIKGILLTMIQTHNMSRQMMNAMLTGNWVTHPLSTTESCQTSSRTGVVQLLDSGHRRQATAKCGRERQEGDRVATGRRHGGDRKTTGKRQESGGEATGSDRQATGRQQGRCDRRATGKQQGATEWRQGYDGEATGNKTQRQDKRQESERKTTGGR